MEFKKQMDSVLILGKGGSLYTSSIIMNEYNDNIPVWTLNDGISPKASTIENLHFEIHKPRHHTDSDIINKFKTSSHGFSEDLFTIVTHDDLPLDEIINKFKTNFLFNTLSYEIALALYLGYTTIYLFGVDAFLNAEICHKEKLSVEFWIGIAKGSGVRVVKPTKGSSLFKTVTQEYVDNFNYGVKAGKGLSIPSKYLEEGNLYI